MGNKTQHRVIALCARGRFQNYLLNCLNAQHELVGVVFVDQNHQQTFFQRIAHYLRYFNLVTLFQHIKAKYGLVKYEKFTEHRLKTLYPELDQWQHCPVGLSSISVADVNDSSVLSFVKQHQADVICVNGTNLIREPLLSYSANLPYGMINLHTGLSPYSRGGNCNLFMLLEGQPQLVGGTIHYIDKGIDSGDIIHTFRPLIDTNDPYELIEAKVFIEGMKKLSAAVSDIANNKAQRIKQWEQGKLFLLRTGYQYTLYHRLLVNQKLQQGLISDYHAQQEQLDRDVKLIGVAE